MNAHEQLSKSLKGGEINHNNIQIAYRAWIRQRQDIPESVRGLLGGHKDDPGLLDELFRGISHVIGATELPYRRGYAEGFKDGKKGVKQ